MTSPCSATAFPHIAVWQSLVPKPFAMPFAVLAPYGYLLPEPCTIYAKEQPAGFAPPWSPGRYWAPVAPMPSYVPTPARASSYCAGPWRPMLCRLGRGGRFRGLKVPGSVVGSGSVYSVGSGSVVQGPWFKGAWGIRPPEAEGFRVLALARALGGWPQASEPRTECAEEVNRPRRL